LKIAVNRMPFEIQSNDLGGGGGDDKHDQGKQFTSKYFSLLSFFLVYYTFERFGRSFFPSIWFDRIKPYNRTAPNIVCFQIEKGLFISPDGMIY